MIEEIKALKIGLLTEIISNYEKLDKQLKNLIEERERIRKEYENLPIVPFVRYSWFDKHIFKRKEYKQWHKQRMENDEYQKKMYQEKEERLTDINNQIDSVLAQIEKSEEKVRKAREEVKEINETKSLKDLGLTLKDAMDILQKEGKTIVLTEADKVFPHNDVDYSGIEDFVLVHKTNYFPTGSKIRTSLSKGVVIHEEVSIGNKKISIPYRSCRDTIHFSVNGEVGSHIFGNWDKCKYAVLLPMDSCNKSKICSAPPQDTFFDGDVELPDSAWVLCPQGEAANIKRMNPNVQIIEYEGDNVSGYADCLVSLLGYRVEKVGMHSWYNSESAKKYCEIIEAVGLTVNSTHEISLQSEQEDSRNAIVNLGVQIETIMKNFSKNEIKENKQALFSFFKISMSGLLGCMLNENNEHASFNECIEKLKEEVGRFGVELPVEIMDIAEDISQDPVGYKEKYILELYEKEYGKDSHYPNFETFKSSYLYTKLGNIVKKKVENLDDILYENIDETKDYFARDIIGPLLTGALIKGMERTKEQEKDSVQTRPEDGDPRD